MRVLVFTGAGAGVFIAHYEVGELAVSAERSSAAPKREAAAPAELHPFHRFILRLQRASFVTIAAINGSTAGGGLEFALGCDFRLAMAGDFRLGLPETSVGIIPGAGGTQRFARLLGTAKALDLILHAQTLSPTDALRADSFIAYSMPRRFDNRSTRSRPIWLRARRSRWPQRSARSTKASSCR